MTKGYEKRAGMMPQMAMWKISKSVGLYVLADDTNATAMMVPLKATEKNTTEKKNKKNIYV